MKAGRFFSLFSGRDDNADVYVDLDGTQIPVISARYEPGDKARVVIRLDQLKLLVYLDKVKNAPEEETSPQVHHLSANGDPHVKTGDSVTGRWGMVDCPQCKRAYTAKAAKI